MHYLIELAFQQTLLFIAAGLLNELTVRATERYHPLKQHKGPCQSRGNVMLPFETDIQVAAQ